MPFTNEQSHRYEERLNHFKSEETRLQKLKTFLLQAETFLIYVDNIVPDADRKKEIHDAIFKTVEELV